MKRERKRESSQILKGERERMVANWEAKNEAKAFFIIRERELH